MILAIASFLLIFAAMNIAYLFLRRHTRRADTRLQTRRLTLPGEPGTPVRQQAAAVLIRRDRPEGGNRIRAFASRIQSDERLGQLLERAGVHYGPARFIRMCALTAVLGGALFLCIAPHSLALIAVPFAATCGVLPLFRLKRKVRRRVQAFEEQFPEGLEFVSRSMRAGHAFSVSLEMLYREFDDPMAGEFRRIFEEQNLGMPLDAALARFSVRVPLLDAQFFTSAVLLQRKTGGNLTEILDKLAQLIRERYKLRGKIRAVSAHGRMTGKVLCAIPMFVGALMFFVNRDYADFFLGTVLGKEMIASALGLQIVGYLVIRKIVNIEI
ncbi:MAG: type II secretion system F family protein [Acidobacteriota bacterium]|nr:type II secretion system F family protein [Acidobacteriota bacterium]